MECCSDSGIDLRAFWGAAARETKRDWTKHVVFPHDVLIHVVLTQPLVHETTRLVQTMALSCRSWARAMDEAPRWVDFYVSAFPPRLRVQALAYGCACQPSNASAFMNLLRQVPEQFENAGVMSPDYVLHHVILQKRRTLRKVPDACRIGTTSYQLPRHLVSRAFAGVCLGSCDKWPPLRDRSASQRHWRRHVVELALKQHVADLIATCEVDNNATCNWEML